MICDLAETYGILDYKGLSLELVATLTFGLKDNSRIKQSSANINFGIDTMLFAHMVDQLAFLSWSKTQDGQKGRNRPKSMVQLLSGKEKKTDIVVFDSADDFERARLAILGR